MLEPSLKRAQIEVETYQLPSLTKDVISDPETCQTSATRKKYACKVCLVAGLGLQCLLVAGLVCKKKNMEL